MKLIAEGYKNKEIAEVLCISLKTVEKHHANLMKNLDLHNAAVLTVYAVERGLVNRWRLSHFFQETFHLIFEFSGFDIHFPVFFCVHN